MHYTRMFRHSSQLTEGDRENKHIVCMSVSAVLSCVRDTELNQIESLLSRNSLVQASARTMARFSNPESEHVVWTISMSVWCQRPARN